MGQTPAPEPGADETVNVSYDISAPSRV